MSGYVKLFNSILQSTVWDLDPSSKVVWITLLALSDKHGEISASVPGLAKSAGVQRADCESALVLFLSPDRDSRTRAYEGRRIEEIDGGWRLLNHEFYQRKLSAEDIKERNAEKQRRWRERNRERNRVLPNVTDVTGNNQNNPLSLISDADADADAAVAAEADAPVPVASTSTSDRITPKQIFLAWHRELNAEGGVAGTLHALHAWIDDYAAVAAALNQLPAEARTVAANALCAWFWRGADGPIASGRIKRRSATPGHLAKRVSSDLQAAAEWYVATGETEREIAQ